MMIWWIWCALLAAEPATGDRFSVEIELRPLPAGLRLEREPRALVLRRDGVVTDRLALPVAPKKAQRKDDHAVLALGSHGLWLVRLHPAGRFVVVARHRLARLVDGFFFEDARVIPTAGGRPIPSPPRVSPPSHDPDLQSLGERLRALPIGDLSRMSTWPGPEEVDAPVSARPRVYLESSSFLTMPFPAWTRDVEIGDRQEIMVLRAGFHLSPNHVLGLGLWVNFRTYDNDPATTDKRYILGDYTNRFLLFYKYSFPDRRIELQVEPLHTRIREAADEWLLNAAQDVWGVRLGVAWVKRSGPLRIGVEGRVDLFARFVLPSLSMILGINF